MRPLLWLCGTALLVWAVIDPRFRNAEGSLSGTFCLPLSMSAGLLGLGWMAARPYRKFGLWLALGLVGQAVALQLIEAGPLVHYQHYKPFGRLIRETPLLLLLFLLAQTALVAGGLGAAWPDLRVRRILRLWQVLAVAGVSFLASAAVSRDVQLYAAELLFAALVEAVNLGNVVLAALSFPQEKLAALEHRIALSLGQPAVEKIAPPGCLDRFAVLAAAWVTLAAALLNISSYQRHPHVSDEAGYLHHARYFAAGMLTMPAPPAPDAFNLDLMTFEKDRWYSPVPPGWPAMLALGVLLGVPWLVNPVLAGCNVLLAYLFLQEIYDRRTARIAVLLLCFSPWHVFMAMNFMTHTSSLLCALVAALGVARARRTTKSLWAGLGGLGIGGVLMIRPLEGLALAGLLGLWAIWGSRRLCLPAMAALASGPILMGALELRYNLKLTGDPLAFPLMAYFDKYYGPKRNALGFGPERGLGWPIDPYPGHSLLDAAINAGLNTFSLNIELLGWSTGSLILLMVLLFSGRMGGGDCLMLAAIAGIFGVHIFYWFSGGPDFGARYWYLMLIPCVALTARGIQFLEAAAGAGQGARVMVGVFSLCALALVNYFPWRAIDKYYHYLRMRPDIRELARRDNFGKSLVLIRGKRFPDYASAAAYNPVNLYAAAPIYVWDRNPEVRAQALRTYPDRPLWVIEGPTITGAGFRVREGPVAAGQPVH